MNINSRQKNDILIFIQDIAYSRNDKQYEEQYKKLLVIMNNKVKEYYNTNWHGIKKQWVEGLKNKQMNLGVSTNNRIESFF
jgi:hypothetical protein